MQGMAGRIAQITNISPQATPEQIKTMFQFLGVVEESMLYPIMDDPSNPITKVGFVKYEDSSSVNVAQHLTNTVFIDRALIVVPYDGEKIPDEMIAMHLPATVSVGGVQQPTVLPNVDPAKLDEIQRTVYVGNLDSKNATAEQLMAFFGGCGEVRYVRMAGDETQPTRFAFVEFGSSVGVQKAIMMNGLIFGDRPIKIEKCRRGLQIRNDEILNRCANVDVYRINHSNNAIVKPPMTGGGGKVVGGADAREIDEAMRRVREAQSLIAKALEPEKAVTAKKRSRSRSRSRHRRHRSRSRDRSSRRRRSRSRSHGRSRSRRSRSRSRDRRRSRRSRSKSKDRRRSKRSRSRSRKKKSKSKSPKKSRSKSPSKKTSSSKSSKSAKDKDRKSDRDRDRDKKRSDRKKDRSEDENESKSKKKRKSSESGDEKKAQNGNHQEGEAIPVIKTDA